MNFELLDEIHSEFLYEIDLLIQSNSKTEYEFEELNEISEIAAINLRKNNEFDENDINYYFNFYEFDIEDYINM